MNGATDLKSATRSEIEQSCVALIPGGVRGIGRAIALELASCGWTIAVCYRKNEKAAAALRSDLQTRGVRSRVVSADVSDPAVAQSLVKEVEGAFGHIDALINCVGFYHRVPLMQESVEGWRAMFDNNLHPVFYLCRAAAECMIRRQRGRIINFGIVNADQLVGQAFITAHYISKVGVLVLTRSLAKILAPHGITVNAISPGFIETGGAPAGEMAQSYKKIPAGYLGDPGDIVAAAMYLLSDEARYVNGANIQVSGGWGV